MSSNNINISWGVSPRFNEVDLELVLGRYSAIKMASKSEYELGLWKVNGLTIKLFKETLVAQGKYTTSGINIVNEIKKLKGLSLDHKNRSKLIALRPSSQNALICDECGEFVYAISSSVENLDVFFKNECGHRNNVNAPFIMCVNRIMPDINVLKSRNLSRLIELGFFENCEVLIPKYMMDCLDQYLEGSKTTISNEISLLRDLEKKGLIKIKHFNDGFDIPASRDEFGIDEDTTLLDIADITNSVFITCDVNCRDQATLRNRPVIFIDHDTTRNTKILHKLRTPS